MVKEREEQRISAGVNPLRDMREGRVSGQNRAAVIDCNEPQPYTRFGELGDEIQKEISYQHQLVDRLTLRLSSVIIPEDVNTANPIACTEEPTQQLAALAELLNRHKVANALLERLLHRIYL